MTVKNTQLVSQEMVLAALRKVQDPELRRDLVSLNMIRDLKTEGDRVSFTIVLTTPACPLRDTIEQDARQAVAALPGVSVVDIKVDANVPTDGRLSSMLDIPVRNSIAIASGKAGLARAPWLSTWQWRWRKAAPGLVYWTPTSMAPTYPP